jgi:hypothetical protein
MSVSCISGYVAAFRRRAGPKATAAVAAAAPAVGAAVVAVGLSLIALRVTPPEYSAAVVVGPTARSGGAGAGMRIADAGRDASVGAAEPGAADEVLSDFSRYLELLRAVPVAERLMAEPGAARRLLPDRWDEATQSWAPSAGLWATLKRGVLTAAGRPAWRPPDAVTLSDLLRRRVVVSPVGTGPMRRIVFRHPDREVALATLRLLTAAADERLKAEAARRARAQIDYVRARLVTETLEIHRAALARLLADEERTLMALGVDLPFAADVIEAPHAPALPDWPDALLTVAVSAAAAFSIAVFFIGRRLSARGGR